MSPALMPPKKPHVRRPLDPLPRRKVEVANLLIVARAPKLQHRRRHGERLRRRKRRQRIQLLVAPDVPVHAGEVQQQGLCDEVVLGILFVGDGPGELVAPGEEADGGVVEGVGEGEGQRRVEGRVGGVGGQEGVDGRQVRGFLGRGLVRGEAGCVGGVGEHEVEVGDVVDDAGRVVDDVGHGDGGAEVGAVQRVAVVAELRHEGGEEGGVFRGGEAGCEGRGGEAVPGEVGGDDVEGGLGGGGGVGEGVDDFLPFETGRGPAVEEEDGDGVFAVAAFVDEVEVEGGVAGVVSAGGGERGVEVGEVVVDGILDLEPVVLFCPVFCGGVDVGGGRAVEPCWCVDGLRRTEFACFDAGFFYESWVYIDGVWSRTCLVRRGLLAQGVGSRNCSEERQERQGRRRCECRTHVGRDENDVSTLCKSRATAQSIYTYSIAAVQLLHHPYPRCIVLYRRDMIDNAPANSSNRPITPCPGFQDLMWDPSRTKRGTTSSTTSCES